MHTARKNAEVPSQIDPWVSVLQASKELGIAHATVKTLALRGELQGQMVAGRLVIHRDSIASYRCRRENAEAGAR